jgi:hypothetical protein
MRWVTPLLMVGTRDDADRLSYHYLADGEQATAAMQSGNGVVVPDRPIAAQIIIALGASKQWVAAHVTADWAEEPRGRED